MERYELLGPDSSLDVTSPINIPWLECNWTIEYSYKCVHNRAMRHTECAFNPDPCVHNTMHIANAHWHQRALQGTTTFDPVLRVDHMDNFHKDCLTQIMVAVDARFAGIENAMHV